MNIIFFLHAFNRNNKSYNMYLVFDYYLLWITIWTQLLVMGLESHIGIMGYRDLGLSHELVYGV